MSSQRRRTAAAARPNRVYIVIHDKEPQDSGSDYRYSAFLASRQDTIIVGVYYDYNNACHAAGDYVRETFDMYEDEDDDDSDSEDQFSDVDWEGDGWFRREECDANECDDRVHIQEHRVR